jgi:RND family efflux transporter MFP subunit
MEKETFLKKALKFLKKPWVLVVLGVVVVIIVISAISGNGKSALETVTVVRGNVFEEVSVTGKVKPARSVDLAFEKSGRIVSVRADVGQGVYAGQAIVILDTADLEAQRSKAEADLLTKQADLAKANVDLSNDYASIVNVLNDGYAKSDDAVKTKTNSLFTGSQSGGYQLTFNSCDAQATIDATALRRKSDAELAAWYAEKAGLSAGSSRAALEAALRNAEDHLNVFKGFLEKTNDNLTTTCIGGNSAYDTARTNVTTARTNVNVALTAVMNQKQAIDAEAANISSLEAGVRSYEASLENIRAQIRNMTIYSPISGVVTLQNAKVGEIASANSTMVSVISQSSFEVEVNVPEADIAKVKVGDAGIVTLDTYGNEEEFEVKVSSVEPAETVVEGVATYKTKFQFLKKDDRIKSGMTANVTVFTDKRENALVIPQRLVKAKDGTRTVMIDLGEGKTEERIIKTGLRGSDGNVEVLEGLNEGDRLAVNSL